MDVHHEHNEIIFVWDEEKAQKNRIKHKGVMFEKAVEAFFDPFLVFIDTSRNLEHRDGIIGKISTSQLLFVVHTQLKFKDCGTISCPSRYSPPKGLFENCISETTCK